MIYLNAVESLILLVLLAIFFGMELLKTYKPRTANRILKVYKKIYRKAGKTVLLILIRCINSLNYLYL